VSKDEISQAKTQLRDQYRRQRADSFINDSWLHIVTAAEFIGKQSIASYVSYEVEPNTQDLNQRLIADGFQLFLPRTLKNNDLEWVLWDGNPKNLKKVGKIFEPIGNAVDPQLDVIILPALHIDQSGNRLGQGAGSYDRALAKSNAWKIALVHPGEITSDPLPITEFDQRVDAAATPSTIIRFAR